VIATGTPPGVGFARNPPVFLKPGDQMEVLIEGMGGLGNPVVSEDKLLTGKQHAQITSAIARSDFRDRVYAEGGPSPTTRRRNSRLPSSRKARRTSSGRAFTPAATKPRASSPRKAPKSK
jgi:hypothetical protein